MIRPSNRQANELRHIQFQRRFTQHAAGSVLTTYGNTQIICTASVTEGVPRFLKDAKQGWLTAEYSMLPSATHERTQREASRGKQTGRTIEIQRLIGRSLRAAVDLKALKDLTITIDCDVIQADGGTRTAAISGACVALYDALEQLVAKKRLKKNPLRHFIAAVSVGLYQDTAVLDLDYAEDSQCDTDMNIIMTEQGEFIEIQGTAEGLPFNSTQLVQLIRLAEQGTAEIIQKQKAVFALQSA